MATRHWRQDDGSAGPPFLGKRTFALARASCSSQLAFASNDDPWKSAAMYVPSCAENNRRHRLVWGPVPRTLSKLAAWTSRSRVRPPPNCVWIEHRPPYSQYHLCLVCRDCSSMSAIWKRQIIEGIVTAFTVERQLDERGAITKVGIGGGTCDTRPVFSTNPYGPTLCVASRRTRA